MFSYLGAFLTSDLTVNVARIVFVLGILAGVAVGFACWLLWNCDIFDEGGDYDSYTDASLAKRLAPAAKLLAWVAAAGVIGGFIGALVGALIVHMGCCLPLR